MFKRRRGVRGNCANDRRGAATVELAVCLPMLVVLVFGSIQACDLILLKQAMTTAAYEGTLELVRPDSSTAGVRTRVEQLLDLRGVDDYTVTIEPAGVNLAETVAGTPITITVSASTASNLMLNGFFAVSSRIETQLVCPR